MNFSDNLQYISQEDLAQLGAYAYEPKYAEAVDKNLDSIANVVGATREDDNFKKHSSDLKYIIALTSFFVKFRNLQWSINSQECRRELDFFANELYYYINEVAEMIQGIIGKFDADDIHEISIPVGKCPIEITNLLKETIIIWYKEHEHDADYIGILSTTSRFLERIPKILYQLRLCKGE